MAVTNLHHLTGHDRPVWKTDMISMLSALRACYCEAEESGVLKGSGNASAMFRFLFPKLVFAVTGGSTGETGRDRTGQREGIPSPMD